MSITVKNETGVVYGQYLDMRMETCINCGLPFSFPVSLYNELQRGNTRNFYCPNGHGQHYARSTEQKLREQLEKQKQEAAEQIRKAQETEKFWLDHWQAQVDENKKVKRELKRVKKRAHNGVCPCCNRTFQNVQNHIQNKHPELIEKKGNPFQR